MVHKMLHHVGLELMQNRHRHHAGSKTGKENSGPRGRVFSAYCHLVARLKPRSLKKDMHLGNYLCHIFILEIYATKIRQSHRVPVFHYCFPDQLIERFIIFHSMPYCLKVKIKFKMLRCILLKFYAQCTASPTTL